MEPTDESLRPGRPDGRSPAFYERFRSVDLEELAWEFLRRSELFQSDCRDVVSGVALAHDVAARWGLYKFKDYRNEGKPRFLPTLVRYFPNRSGAPLSRRITLQPGQVALVLNAHSLANFQQAEEALKKRLWRRVELYLDEMGRTRVGEPKEIQLREANYPESLQLLDLLHADVDPALIKQLVPSIKLRLPRRASTPDVGGKKRLGAKDDAVDKSAANKRFSVLRKQATQLANEGYIELAVVGAARRLATKKADNAD